MTSEKSALSHDLDALAREACDLWQEHLASYAADPKARAELMRALEPSRRLFAEWAFLMQHGSYGKGFFGKNAAGSAGRPSAETSSDSTEGRRSGSPGAVGPAGAAAARPAFDGRNDVMARLADHAAQLEKRVAELEEKMAGLGSGNDVEADTPLRTPRSRAKL